MGGVAPSSAALPRQNRAQTLLLSLAALLAALVFLALVVIAVAVLAWIALGLFDALPDPDRKWPRLSAWAIALVPAAALVLAFFVSRRSEGGTFYAQQRTNRWISVLLLVTIIGLLVALGEAIAASVSFSSYGALVGAGLASVLGVGAAIYANFRGPNAILSSARARTPDPARERVLFDVVRELSIAANMPPPTVADRRCEHQRPRGGHEPAQRHDRRHQRRPGGARSGGAAGRDRPRAEPHPQP